MHIKPIETSYKGYRFRSRLEARWAVFFDALNIRWEYEPEGFDLGKYGYYLPDFFLPDLEAVVEIKADNIEVGYQINDVAEKTYTVAANKSWIGAVFCGTPGDERVHVLCWDIKESGSGGQYYWQQNHEWFHWWIGPDGNPRFWYDAEIPIHHYKNGYKEYNRTIYRDSGFEFRMSPATWDFVDNRDYCTGWRLVVGEATKAARSARFEHTKRYYMGGHNEVFGV